MMIDEGARLVITYIDEEGLETITQILRNRGGEVVPRQGDVTYQNTHVGLVADAISHFWGLHGWCNIAGIIGTGHLPDITLESFDRLMHINCFSQLLTAREAAPAMNASGGGGIVNVGLVALPYMTVYCASKATVIRITLALAAELAPDIRCNVVCPGGID
jgi:NAD(P)-dependent dehydrogenase (short-subunit alcohol dehydrogenase family)